MNSKTVHQRGILLIAVAAGLWGSLGVAGRFAFAAEFRLPLCDQHDDRGHGRHPAVHRAGLGARPVAAGLRRTAHPGKTHRRRADVRRLVLVVRGYDLASLRVTLPGILAGLASGFTYALYSIFGKTVLRRYQPQTTLTYALGFGSIFLGLMTYATGQIDTTALRAGWPMIAYLGLITTLLAQFLYLSGLRHVEAGRASLIATVEPVVAAVLGYVLLRERLDLLQALGGLAVLSGVFFVRRLPVPPSELPPTG